MKVLDHLHWILPALPGGIVEGGWGKELWVARVTESVIYTKTVKISVKI